MNEIILLNDKTKIKVPLDKPFEKTIEGTINGITKRKHRLVVSRRKRLMLK